jgi:hypothetical protein
MFYSQILDVFQTAAFRIHETFVWIRIRIRGLGIRQLTLIWIRGSMPLTNGTRTGVVSGSCYFRHWPPSKHQQKTSLKKFICLILFEGTYIYCTSFQS